MRLVLLRVCLASFMLSGVLPSLASVTTRSELHPMQSEVVPQEQSMSDVPTALESLRQDVGRHPEDFIAFETRISANRFIEEHEGAFRETERRMLLHGVVGYWQGKTLVVLPSLTMELRLIQH